MNERTQQWKRRKSCCSSSLILIAAIFIIPLICIQIVIVESNHVDKYSKDGISLNRQNNILRKRRNRYRRDKASEQTKISSKPRYVPQYTSRRLQGGNQMDGGMNPPTTPPSVSPVTSRPTPSPTREKYGNMVFPTVVQNWPTIMQNLPTAFSFILKFHEAPTLLTSGTDGTDLSPVFYAHSASDSGTNSPVSVTAPVTPAPATPAPYTPAPVYTLAPVDPPVQVVLIPSSPPPTPVPTPKPMFWLPPYLMIVPKPTPVPSSRSNFWLPPYLMIVPAPIPAPIAYVPIQYIAPPTPAPVPPPTTSIPTISPSGRPSAFPTIDFFKRPVAPIPWWAPPPKPSPLTWDQLWPTNPRATPRPSALFVETPSSWWIQQQPATTSASGNSTMVPLQEFIIQVETSTGKVSTTTLTNALQDYLYNALIFPTLDNVILHVTDEKTEIGNTASAIITSTSYSGIASFDTSSSSKSPNVFDSLPTLDSLYQQQDTVLHDLVSLQASIDKYFLTPGDNEDVVTVVSVTVGNSTNPSSNDDHNINTGAVVGITAVLAIVMIALGVYVIIRQKRKQMELEMLDDNNDVITNDMLGSPHGNQTDKMALINKNSDEYGSSTKGTKVSGEHSISMSSNDYIASELNDDNTTEDIITQHDDDQIDHHDNNFMVFGIDPRSSTSSPQRKHDSPKHSYWSKSNSSSNNSNNKKSPSFRSSKTSESGSTQSGTRIPTLIKTLSRTGSESSRKDDVNQNNNHHNNNNNLMILEHDYSQDDNDSSKASTSSMKNLVTPASQLYAISTSWSSSSASGGGVGMGDDDLTNQTDEQPSTENDIVTILRTDTDTVNTPQALGDPPGGNSRQLPLPSLHPSFDHSTIVPMDPETQEQLIQVQQQQQQPSSSPKQKQRKNDHHHHGGWGGRHDAVDF